MRAYVRTYIRTNAVVLRGVDVVRRETGREVNARGEGGIRTVQKMGVVDGGVADAAEVLGEWRMADPRRAQEGRAIGRPSMVRANVGCEPGAVRTAVSVSSLLTNSQP